MKLQEVGDLIDGAMCQIKDRLEPISLQKLFAAVVTEDAQQAHQLSLAACGCMSFIVGGDVKARKNKRDGITDGLEPIPHRFRTDSPPIPCKEAIPRRFRGDSEAIPR